MGSSSRFALKGGKKKGTKGKKKRRKRREQKKGGKGKNRAVDLKFLEHKTGQYSSRCTPQDLSVKHRDEREITGVG